MFANRTRSSLSSPSIFDAIGSQAEASRETGRSGAPRRSRRSSPPACRATTQRSHRPARRPSCRGSTPPAFPPRGENAIGDGGTGGAVFETEGLSPVTGTQSGPGPETLRGDPSQLNVLNTSKGSLEPNRTKRLMGFEPTTFCMASSTCAASLSRNDPANQRFRGCCSTSRFPDLYREITGVCGPNVDPASTVNSRAHNPPDTDASWGRPT